MNNLYLSLGLGMPEQAVPPHDSHLSDIKALSTWVEALPLANATVCADMLLSALRSMNKLLLKGRHRFDALEVLRPAVVHICQHLDRQILKLDFPLPVAKQNLGLTVQGFHQELGLGYRLAVFDLCAPKGTVPLFKGGTVATALSRALLHESNYLVRAYILYSVPKAGTWLRIHQLFQFANELGLQSKKGDDPVSKSSSSIEQLYIQTLLLAICNPYRLSQKEIFDTAEATSGWTTFSELKKMESVTGEQIVITFDQDLGPGYLPEERSQADAGDLVLDLSKLIAEVHLRINATAGMSDSISIHGRNEDGRLLQIQLVKRLLQTWKPAPERSHSRIAARHSLTVVIGLHGLHYYLSGGNDFSGFISGMRGSGISLNEQQKAAAWSGRITTETPLTTSAKVLDQSLGGYRLVISIVDGLRPRVGELIGLLVHCEGNAISSEWMLGVIRWLRYSESDEVEAGVVLLSRRLRPASLRLLGDSDAGRAAIRAVELESLKLSGNQPKSYVVEMVGDQAMPNVEITLAPDIKNYETKPEVETFNSVELIESGVSYVQFSAVAKAEVVESEY